MSSAVFQGTVFIGPGRENGHFERHSDQRRFRRGSGKEIHASSIHFPAVPGNGSHIADADPDFLRRADRPGVHPVVSGGNVRFVRNASGDGGRPHSLRAGASTDPYAGDAKGFGAASHGGSAGDRPGAGFRIPRTAP